MPLSGKLLLSGVTVVDTHDGKLTPDMSILMDKGKIVGIAPTGTLRTDASTKKIDATGKFVVPGYIDMHAHVLNVADPTDSLTLMLANGITGWRQMAGSPSLLEERRHGTLPMSGVQPKLLAMPGTILTVLNAGTPTAGVKTVREEKAQGADFIKMILTSAPTFAAVQAEATRLGLPMVGHLPPGVDIVAASRGGMKSVEHLGAGTGLMIPCSTDEVAMRAAIAKARLLEGFPYNVLFLIPFKDNIMKITQPRIVTDPDLMLNPRSLADMRRIISTFSEAKCRRLAAEFIANGTWQVPTLIREKTSMLADAPEFSSDPNLRYMSPSDVKLWRDTEQKFVKQFSIADRQTLRDFYELHLKLVGLFDAAGVKMMTGDDAVGAIWVVPGFAMHQEFDEFAKAGVSPLHVLQDTTINPAIFLGQTSTMGSVETGKNADLVLLGANPISSVQNLHRIVGVIRGGFYFSGEDIAAMKKKVSDKQAKAAAN
jgi:imidazolonepropionase-like amidohydrolase